MNRQTRSRARPRRRSPRSQNRVYRLIRTDLGRRGRRGEAGGSRRGEAGAAFPKPGLQTDTHRSRPVEANGSRRSGQKGPGPRSVRGRILRSAAKSGAARPDPLRTSLERRFWAWRAPQAWRAHRGGAWRAPQAWRAPRAWRHPGDLTGGDPGRGVNRASQGPRLHRGADGAEDRADLAAQIDQGDDGHDGDENEDQRVLREGLVVLISMMKP